MNAVGECVVTRGVVVPCVILVLLRGLKGLVALVLVHEVVPWYFCPCVLRWVLGGGGAIDLVFVSRSFIHSYPSRPRIIE